MTPEFASKVRRARRPLLLALLLVVVAVVCWKIDYGGGIHIPPVSEVIPSLPTPEEIEAEVEPEPDLGAELADTFQEVMPETNVGKWATVNTNSVLVWEMDGDQCARRSAHSQWHEGETVLILSEQGGYTEVEADDQTKTFTRGCVKSELLDILPQ